MNDLLGLVKGGGAGGGAVDLVWSFLFDEGRREGEELGREGEGELRERAELFFGAERCLTMMRPLHPLVSASTTHYRCILSF